MNGACSKSASTHHDGMVQRSGACEPDFVHAHALRVAGVNSAHMVRADGPPAVLYGCECMGVSNTALDAVRSKVATAAAARCLEYLIRRFKIHVYNVEAAVTCALPYHATAEFVKLVQLANRALMCACTPPLAQVEHYAAHLSLGRVDLGTAILQMILHAIELFSHGGVHEGGLKGE